MFLHYIYCRWSLIAGRLPGRTVNDVKNYWNIHLRKKFINPSNKDLKQKGHLPHGHIPSKYPNNCNNNVVIIKPQPRTLGKRSFIGFDHCGNSNNNNNNNATTTSNNCLAAGADSDYKGDYCNPGDNDEIMWWENLLMNDNEVDEQHQGGGDGCFNNYSNNYLRGILGPGDFAKLNSVDEEERSGEKGNGKLVEEDKNKSSWDQLFSDVELWNTYSPEPESCV